MTRPRSTWLRPHRRTTCLGEVTRFVACRSPPFEGRAGRRLCRSEQRMAMVEQHAPDEWAEPAQVPPHTYPLWVVPAAALVLLSALYSFTPVPALVEAGRNLHPGQPAPPRGHNTTA